MEYNDNVCENCVMRLYNKKVYRITPIGSSVYGRCIVVPNTDYSAYKNKDLSYSSYVDIISEELNPLSSTGVLTSEVAILPLIRCCDKVVKVDITDDIYNKCFNHLAKDFFEHNYTDILLTGDAARKFLGISNINEYLDTMFVSKHGRRYVVNYSPFIVYSGDTDKIDEYKSHLIRWYNAIKTKDYSNYKIIRL